MKFTDVTLSGPPELRAFYSDVLGLTLDDDAIRVGETLLRFEPGDGSAFYHFALLVPGDRFDPVHAWARERVELLGDVFESDAWDSQAVYFHDPAGNIVEPIAHHGLEESGRGGPFAAEELVGFSELGIVGDRRQLLERLHSTGLELWDGELDEPDRLAFVGEKGRTLILAPPGRGWVPTSRPAEPHPVELVLELAGARVPLRF
jgi:catechol 2,3-dioxygenase-like lactoylglutathione lyase family enzyme